MDYAKLSGKKPLNPGVLSYSQRYYRKKTVKNAEAKKCVCGVPVLHTKKGKVRKYCRKTYIRGLRRKGCHLHNHGYLAMLDRDEVTKLTENQASNGCVTTFDDHHIGGRGVKSLVTFSKLGSIIG